jgi:hypothetical protein
MGGGFQPYRREMRWLDSDEAPIRPLLERLAFTRNGANWGYRLRLGLFEITPGDMAVIAAAMGAELPAPRRADDPKPAPFSKRAMRRAVGPEQPADLPQAAGD